MSSVIIRVTEEPDYTVRVEYKGEVHQGTWKDDDSLVGEHEVSATRGDRAILAAALTAWQGQEGEFALTEEELAKQGGGFWAPAVTQ